MPNTTATQTGPIAVQVTVSVTAWIYPEPEAGGFSAEVPALQGCYTQGETLEEVQANLQEAAQGWLDSVHQEANSAARVTGAA
jgi:predicted RNase H-like HicB family nuclease